MKKLLLISIFATSVLSFQTFGQTYEKVYADSSPEIQERMNQNKRSGLDILSGVTAKHQVGISGLSASQKDALITSLSENDKVQNVLLSTDLKSLTIFSSAWFTKDSIQTLLNTFSVSMIGYTVNYSLIEEN